MKRKYVCNVSNDHHETPLGIPRPTFAAEEETAIYNKGANRPEQTAPTADGVETPLGIPIPTFEKR